MLLLDPSAHPTIAHRGASGSRPENTFLAFQHALAVGADAIEYDVRLTGDGVPVVFHDELVDRTTNGSGRLGALSLTDVLRLDAGHGERVPVLAEVVDAYRDVPMIIELKEVGSVDQVIRILRPQSNIENLVIASFSHRALQPFRRAGFRTFASRREIAAFWMSSKLGIPFPVRPYQGFSVPEWSGGKRIVTTRFVKTAQKAGLPVHVWTIDDEETGSRLRSIGVNGLLTNHPERFAVEGELR